MLNSLFIQNYVLIDNLDIQLKKGFSVITGETGAGKSIILGALGLVLGQRSDAKSIKTGADKCVIEVVFDISKYRLDEFFNTHEMEYDADVCILRRELFASGKSRAFVNDSPVSLSLLKELGTQLIDIHSQHQNLLLADNRFQLKVIDAMAKNESLLSQYTKEYNLYQKRKKELKVLTEEALQSKQEEDYIRFQLEQLSEASLLDGEQEQLETELATLSHAEEIKASLFKLTQLLRNDANGGLTQSIKEANAIASSLERYYPKAKEFSERLYSAFVDLSDLASETAMLTEDIEFHPERQDWVNERLNLIYSLEQKHRVSRVAELIDLFEKYNTQLDQIDSFDAQIEQMKTEIKSAYRDLLNLATQLSQRRKAASTMISSKLIEMVVPLGMPNTRFRIDFHSKSEPESEGMDEIHFMFSANKSGDLEKVAQSASGGEISRLMLCVKAMISGFTALPTIIFDEIDTGVSGDIADRMGDIMHELGTKMQVIAITHLPQIASKGEEHYFVYKQDTECETITQIRTLKDDERIHEIARMLSGATLTDASIANAKELLKLY